MEGEGGVDKYFLPQTELVKATIIGVAKVN